MFENVEKRVRLELAWNWIRIMKPVDVIYLLLSFNNADSTNRDYYYLSSRLLFQIYTQYPPIKQLIKFSLSIYVYVYLRLDESASSNSILRHYQPQIPSVQNPKLYHPNTAVSTLTRRHLLYRPFSCV